MTAKISQQRNIETTHISKKIYEELISLSKYNFKYNNSTLDNDMQNMQTR